MKQLRERAELTQQELASRLDTSVSTVAKWDQGATFPRLYPSQIKALMGQLGCSLDELVEAESNWVKGKG